MSKRLELVWPDKDKVLLGLDENGKPIWGTKADLETRLLVQLEAVGETSPDNLNDLYEQGDNLLIKGDNLLALKALEQHFAGKIKCIYIDPPFNTGNAFEYYDDGLEHTIWLSMMKARLEILRKLLKEDGVIFLHLNNIEVGYSRILLDEIFGRSNFISQIAWERSQRTLLGQGESPIIDTTEYILCYARKKLACQLNKLPKKYPVEDRTLKQYNKLFYPSAQKKLAEEFDDSYGNPVKIYKYDSCRIETISWSDAENRYEELLEVYVRNHEKVIRFSNQQEESSFQQFLISKMDGKSLYEVQYTPSRGKRKGKGISIFYYGRDVVLFLRDYTEKIGNTIYKQDDMNNFWTRQEIPMTGIANEGGVEMRRGKKPEALIKRILDTSTNNPNDWVLDSFLGSGTTAAVAHKIGRKWVGIEFGDQAETHCLPRLKRVVSGEDQTGISKQVGWRGGGGFRYCVLGESLFAKDKDTGLVMINPKYTNGPLVAAVCNLESFYLNNDSLFHGVQGNTYAHITEDKVTQTYLDSLVEKLPEGKNLVVYCLKRAMGLEMPQEVKVKRIPKELQIPRYLTSASRGGGERALLLI